MWHVEDAEFAAFNSKRYSSLWSIFPSVRRLVCFTLSVDEYDVSLVPFLRKCECIACISFLCSRLLESNLSQLLDITGKMSVVIETTVGDLTVDLYLKERPKTCLNFLKLCKNKAYNCRWRNYIC